MKTTRMIIVVALVVGVVVGCASSGDGARIDNIAMYGQPEIERPDVLKKADEEFIRKATEGFGTREEASKAWWAQGEKFMSEGNLDYAMRRYNQSWLLNPNNYQPYWGFARVLLEQDKVNEAIKHLEKAESLINDPFQKVALLSDMGTAYTIKGAKEPAFFEKANRKFIESTSLDPNYGDSWRRWAFSLYEQGEFSAAWGKVKQAEKLNARPFPENSYQHCGIKLRNRNERLTWRSFGRKLRCASFAPHSFNVQHHKE